MDDEDPGPSSPADSGVYMEDAPRMCSVPPLPNLQDLSEVVSIGPGGLYGGSMMRIGNAPWTYRLSKDSNSGPEDGQIGVTGEEPDLNYTYQDTDTLAVEISELYSYSEIDDFAANAQAFDNFYSRWCFVQRSRSTCVQQTPDDKDLFGWSCLSSKSKDVFAEHLIEQCERVESEIRLTAVRAILYMVQGAFNHVGKDAVIHCARENAFRFYRLGAYQIIVQLFLLETDTPRNSLRCPAISIADSREIRILINILYSMIELICRPEVLDCEKDMVLRSSFIEDIGAITFGRHVLLGHVLEFFMRYASNSAPHYPLKKLLLLLWKIILYTCGGSEQMLDNKNVIRVKAGLQPVKDDTLDVARKMRASTPPLSASEIMDGVGKARARPLAKYKPQQIKETEGGMAFWFNNVSESDDPPGLEEDKDEALREEMEVKHIEHPTKRMDSTPEAFTTRPEAIMSKGLPWTPKIRQDEIDRFIHQSRDKFVGVILPEDNATLVGLPKPIEESIQVMRRHMYTSLSDIQIRREEAIHRYPMSQKDDVIMDGSVENLYQIMLPQMGNYVIALLKVLLACSPTSKTKSETLNVITDVVPEQNPTSMVDSMRLGIDSNRHKEIIVKAVSSTILLLLKHFKVNHIYQFETLAQHLVMANCMALILKFLNQNILAYVLAKNEIGILNYPNCCFSSNDLTKENLEVLQDQPYCWRNLHSCINLVRILNKLAKWKRSRILVLVLFKSAAILKRTLRIRHPVMQLYTLKALKLQCKFLGRQWRRLNMKILSAIYEKVRHRLLDDWAYGNVPEHEVKRVDCQAEERKLRVILDCFNNRRYHNILRPNSVYIQPGLEEFQALDYSLANALSIRVRIPEHFKTDYHGWLEREVYGQQIEWDRLLECKNVC